MSVTIITPHRAKLLTLLAAASEVGADGKALRWSTSPELCAAHGGNVDGRAMRNRLRDAIEAGHVSRLAPLADTRVRYIITVAGRLALQRHDDAAQALSTGMRRKAAAKTPRTKTAKAAQPPRDNGKSAKRKKIEALLKQHNSAEGMTSRAIAEALGMEPAAARHTLAGAQTYGTVFNISDTPTARYVHRDTWVSIKAAQPEREAPVRNSNQPIGTVDYWKRHLAWQNTPARVELQK